MHSAAKISFEIVRTHTVDCKNLNEVLFVITYQKTAEIEKKFQDISLERKISSAIYH